MELDLLVEAFDRRGERRFTLRNAITMQRSSLPPDATKRAYYVLYATNRNYARIFAILLLLFLVATCANPARAAEDWNAFLEALKARGYDDVALVYLKTLQEKGEAPPELNDELDYAVGAAAFEEALKATPNKRDALVGQARDAFEKYLQNAPEGNKALEANAGLGRILLEQADRIMTQSGKLDEQARDAARLQARTLYADANSRLLNALKLSQTRARNLQNEPTANPNELRAAQAQFLDLTIRLATAEAQLARSYPLGSDDYVKRLEKAEARFKEIFEKYQQYTGAFKARFSEAEILHELGRDDEALGILSELAVLPFEEQFYALKTRSLLLFAEIAVDKNDPALLMSLLQKFEQWSNGEKLPKSVTSSAEGRRIYLLAGRAVVALETLRRENVNVYNAAGKKTFVETDDPIYKLLNSTRKKTGSNQIVQYAVKTLSVVAAGRSADALEAQKILQTDPIFSDVDLEKSSYVQKAETFKDAADIATREAANYSQARQNANNAAPEVAQEAKHEEEQALADAIDAFNTAFDMSAREFRPDRKGKLDPDAVANAQEELNKLRMKYAAITIACERYEEAFVVADRLARDENFADAGQAAVIAFRALQASAAAARARENEADANALDQRVKAYSEFMAARWESDENSLVGQEAAYAQLDAAIDEGEFETARAALEKIAPETPRRANAELKLGQALWSSWNEQRDATTDDDEPDAETNAKLAALLDDAQRYLLAGLERKVKAGADADDAVAIFATYLLAQTFVEKDDFANAEKWLTHPTIGAVKVCERARNSEEELPRSLAFVNDSFQMAALALQLRLLTTDVSRLDQAEAVMAQLDAIAERSPENATKLTSVYLAIGKRFEERLRALRDNANDEKREELQKAANGFEIFLDEASKRLGENNSYAAQRWIADSYLALGRGLADPKSKPSADAIKYLDKARDTYMNVAKRCQSQPDFAPSATALTSALLGACEADRHAQRFDRAYKGLQAILAKAQDNIDVQREAALLLHAWGARDPKNYVKAIAGDLAQKGGKKLVWGWNGIIKRLAPALEKGERYKELYFEAYRGKTRSRFLYVRSIKDVEERKRQAQSAEEDVRRLYQTNPTMGGAASFAYFERACKEFQKLRGVEPTGLKGKK